MSLGGSISGEHGDGRSKTELLPIMFGEHLMQAFREFKAIWDPELRMNPGKVVDAYRAANGFSCREQIRQVTGRHALHLADRYALALEAEPA